MPAWRRDPLPLCSDIHPPPCPPHQLEPLSTVYSGSKYTSLCLCLWTFWGLFPRSACPSAPSERLGFLSHLHPEMSFRIPVFCSPPDVNFCSVMGAGLETFFPDTEFLFQTPCHCGGFAAAMDYLCFAEALSHSPRSLSILGSGWWVSARAPALTCCSRSRTFRPGGVWAHSRCSDSSWTCSERSLYSAEGPPAQGACWLCPSRRLHSEQVMGRQTAEAGCPNHASRELRPSTWNTGSIATFAIQALPINCIETYN